jgi:tRNA (guanine-N7-)-methyltransferase
VLIPSNINDSLALLGLFPRNLPLEIDLGSGPGKFLIEAAQAFPERNFLGIERLLGRVRKIRRHASELGLRNLKILQFEMAYTVQYLLPPGSISRAHLYFPDPWPKRKHHRRRVIGIEFLRALAHTLQSEGEVLIKTDHQDYFRQITEAAMNTPELMIRPDWTALDYPITDFEDSFLKAGLPVYRLRLSKVI